MDVRNRRLATLILFVVLTVLHTWPLATAPARLTRYDNADAMLNTWILAWVPHALVTDPLHVFDANIFHPERRTLAYSENLILPALLGAPLQWLGVSPVLVHNLVLLAGMVLTGWVTCLVLQRWTGDWAAGVVGGCLVAFNAHTLTRLGHVQAMHAEFLPLAWLALDRLIERPCPRRALALASAFAAQAYCSIYLLVFTATAMVASAFARAGEVFSAGRRTRVIANTVLAAAVAAAVCAPMLWPYARVRAESGLSRSIDEVALYDAQPSDYLATGGRLHYAWWSHRFYRATDALFPGMTALLLSGLAIATGIAWRDSRARMLLVTGLVACVLSFGSHVPGYAWLHAHVPLLQGIRGTSRFGYLVLVAVAGLTAYALAWLRARVAGPAAKTALGIAAFGLVLLEAARFPVSLTPFAGIPRVYDVLAQERDAVVVEFPFATERYVSTNGPYVLASVKHWHRLLNGYSGFTPDSYARHARELGGFPDTRSMSLLARLGVTHVVVHVEHVAEIAAAVEADGTFELLASGHGIRLYRIRRP